MDDTATNDLRLGVKTFFVVPDLSLFPEENLKAFFIKGYETYFLDDDPYCPLFAKISLLAESFPELILFFNIDRQIQGIDWPSFIGAMQKAYGNHVTIGVTFQKRSNPDETRKLERLYLFDIGIVGGCIPLEFQKSKNAALLQNVLMANQANGLRKQLRAICSDAHKVSFQIAGVTFRGVVRDISISHFSCVFPVAPELPLNTKVADIQMNLRGVLCNVDGMLCLRRMIEGNSVHVFIFLTAQGKNGLNPDQLERINVIVYNSITQAMAVFLRALFMNGRERVPSVKAFASHSHLSTDRADTVGESVLESLD